MRGLSNGINNDGTGQWSCIGYEVEASRTMAFQHPKDLVTGDEPHLRDPVRVTEGDTNL